MGFKTRSARNGQYVHPTQATTHPDETVREAIDPPADPISREAINLFGALTACARTHGYTETLRRLRA